MSRRRMRRQKALKQTEPYKQLWRLVDGAVRDAIMMHPTYFPGGMRANLRSSIIKRIVGALEGYVGQPTWGAGASRLPCLTMGGPSKRVRPEPSLCRWPIRSALESGTSVDHHDRAVARASECHQAAAGSTAAAESVTEGA